MDVFYLTQLGYGYYHSGDVEDCETYFITHFDDYYRQFREHITQDVWKEYYSLGYLLQPATAQFWRPPDLRDLPSSNDPYSFLRDKPVGCHNKLPRWADTVINTFYRQRALSEDTITQIAIDSLQDTISRLREHHPEVPPYSETQARFWLKYMLKNRAPGGGPSYFSIFVAQGGCDVMDWDRHYSPERWHAASEFALEPDRNGNTRQIIGWCGWPDGGTEAMTVRRGWVYELASEEEVEFMAAVAAKETEGCSVDALNFSLRSHMLLAVLHLAFVPVPQRQEAHDKIRRGFLEKERLAEATVDEWIQQVLGVMEPYVVEEKAIPATDEERTKLFRRILAENGQLFARGGWKFSKRGPARGFKFDLEMPIEYRKKK